MAQAIASSSRDRPAAVRTDDAPNVVKADPLEAPGGFLHVPAGANCPAHPGVIPCGIAPVACDQDPLTGLAISVGVSPHVATDGTVQMSDSDAVPLLVGGGKRSMPATCPTRARASTGANPQYTRCPQAQEFHSTSPSTQSAAAKQTSPFGCLNLVLSAPRLRFAASRSLSNVLRLACRSGFRTCDETNDDMSQGATNEGFDSTWPAVETKKE